MNEPMVHTPRDRRVYPLTPREAEVLGVIVQGLSNKEAAKQLGISPRTIEVHRARALEKTQAKNSCDLARMLTEQAAEEETRRLVLDLRRVLDSGSEEMHAFDAVCRAHGLEPAKWVPETEAPTP